MARIYSNRAVFTSLSTALALNGAETTVAVGDTTGWPAPGAGDVSIGAIDVGDQGLVEIFSYTGLTATSFTGVVRGLDGTTQPAHSVGAKVRHIASASDIQAIGTKQALSEKGAANGYAGLDAAGDLSVGQMPGTAATVATSEGTTSTAYADLTTAGPAVTLTTGTSALVIVSAQMVISAAGNGAMMAFAVSGASTSAASDVRAVYLRGDATTDEHAGSRAFLIPGLTPGSNTFTAKYRAVVGGTATFRDRDIIVIPL